jgi:hypothetical protein
VIAGYQGGDSGVSGGVIAGYHHNIKYNIRINNKKYIANYFQFIFNLFLTFLKEEKKRKKGISAPARPN